MRQVRRSWVVCFGFVVWCLSTLAFCTGSMMMKNTSTQCFPKGFLIGSATAAYQVEGGWNETGRSPSIWDDFCRVREHVQCANVADDFLHRYKSDIELMSEMGLNSFRFSISWSRVMRWNPDAQRMESNGPGIAFYHELIDALLANGITPIVTLYHWDLPSALETQLKPAGGWLNKSIVHHFAKYAQRMFAEFGSKVHYWTTFNEPWSFTVGGYGEGYSAPGYNDSDTFTYTAAHHVLLAHAHAVDVFREGKRTGIVRQDAKIGIVLNSDYSYPLDPSSASDIEAVERKLQFSLGWYLSPIVNGDYPDVMKQRAGSHLPTFTEDESDMLRDSYDVFMLNHYSSNVVTPCDSNTSVTDCSELTRGWYRDLGVDNSRIPVGARKSSKNKANKYNCNWFNGYPQGYLDIIRYMHKFNTNAPILLTENGWCGNEVIENYDQLWYYQTYLHQVYLAIQEGIPIIGYTAWSLLDNYEWGSFDPRFGLFYVEFNNQTGSLDGYIPAPDQLKRIPRIAAKWLATVGQSRCLHDDANITAFEFTTASSFSQIADNNSLNKSIAICIVVCIGISMQILYTKLNWKKRSQWYTNENSPLLKLTK